MNKSIKEIKKLRREKLKNEVSKTSEIELENIFKSIVNNKGKHIKNWDN